MKTPLTITTERVDDIPLLIGHMTRMGLPSLLNICFPMHGNWQGLWIGDVVLIWLSHLLSEGDHRLNQVQPWAERRLHTLARCLGQAVRPEDVSDDRLAGVLEALADDLHWGYFEEQCNERLVRVYDLHLERVRVDTTTSSGYGQVSADGLLQFGHSKDHRPDLPQLKVLLATLDPLGLPVATEALSGEHADDPLYLPAIARVRLGLRRHGLLYMGDCKMAALETRASLQAADDYYLCPLPATIVSPAQLAAYVAPVTAGTQTLTRISRTAADGTTAVIAEGYACQETLTALVGGQEITWEERRLVVRSLAAARTAEQALHTRIAQAQVALSALTTRRQGKKHWADGASVTQAAAALLAHYRVTDVVQVTLTEHSEEHAVRAYGARPATVRCTRQITVQTAVDADALAHAISLLGWRVYATNHPQATLSLEQAVLAYRDEYVVERSFARLKGHPLSLSPLYLQRDDHITGLVRLLSIALRVLTLLEFVVRRQVAQTGEPVRGLYAAAPTRVTLRPTAEHILAAFRDITLTVVHEHRGRTRGHLPPLSPLQHRLLTLLGLTPALYDNLLTPSATPP
jgi:transposase